MMGNVFSKPKTPKPDPEVERKRLAEEKRIAAEKLKEEKLAANEKAARQAGLRGRASLFNTTAGFLDDEDTGTFLT